MAKRYNTAEFIEKANIVHKNLYDYSSVEYKTTREKVEIKCNRCESMLHIRPANHLSGQGCKKCNSMEFTKKCTKSTTQFIEEAIKVHSNKYDYTLVEYSTSKEKITIKCNQCSNIFTQTPNHHLQGRGCAVCSYKLSGERRRSDTEEFIQKATAIHKSTYDYSLVDYTLNNVPVTIKCNQCSTAFTQWPSMHLSGQGCPTCGKGGFNKALPGILYYLSINNGQAYKIGITNKTVEERFSPLELSSIKVLYAVHYDYGNECYDAEQRIIKEFEAYKYTGSALLRTGNTELFSIDILSKDQIEFNR